MEFTIEKNRIYRQDEQGKLLAELLIPGEEDGAKAITHVFVDESLRDQGIADQLMRAAIAELESQGQQAKAVCPYAVKWFAKHPEYNNLLLGDENS